MCRSIYFTSRLSTASEYRIRKASKGRFSIQRRCGETGNDIPWRWLLERKTGLSSTFSSNNRDFAFDRLANAMTQKPPHVHIEPRHTDCRSCVFWDETSSVLSLSLGYAIRPSEPVVSMVDALDKQLGIRENEYRVVLGALDILLDKEQRMVSFEIRTNPTNWRPAALPPVSGGRDPIFLAFLLDFDDNNIASYDLQVEILQEASRKELSLRFNGYVAAKWVAVADGFFAGLTWDDHLSELRLTDFDVVVPGYR